MTLRVQILKDKFHQSLGLPFKELLPEPVIKQAISELKIKYKKRLFKHQSRTTTMRIESSFSEIIAKLRPI